MASNTVTVGGMFGDGRTYFANSPVVIRISGLQWPAGSPFNIVRVYVKYGGRRVGEFPVDTGGQSSIELDISTALLAIWSGYDFDGEVAMAQAAATATSVAAKEYSREMRRYSLEIFTEYLSGDDGGVFTQTECGEFTGGQCLLGGLTEWERSVISQVEDAHVAHLEHTNLRNGDASTKPAQSPERVGKHSITSWVDIQEGYTRSLFYPPEAQAADDGQSAHAPLVLRDDTDYIDFLFLNRRGAVETCSALTKEAMSISVETQQYGRVERPSFIPSRSLMAFGSDGRRSWQMSSGYVTREWAEWWAQEFLGGKRKRWWMLWKGPGMAEARFVPVVVDASKKSTGIYDRVKQEMPHVDFTVTLALEG